MILAGVVLYVLAQIAIGVLVSRGVRTEDDYLLAGRRLGPWLVTGSMFATWFGAETCLGAAGEVYASGLSLASAEPFAYGLCIGLMGLVFAARLWRGRITTLADVFAARYGRGVERLAALLLIPTSLYWAAAQVRAFGQVLTTVVPIDVEVAVALAAGIAVLYTAFGGLLADAITDLVQGAALVIGLGATLIGVVIALGGPQAALARIPAGSVTLLPPDLAPLEIAEAWAVPILGSIVAQELVARACAARSAAVASNGAIAAGLIYVIVGLVPVTLGLLGAALEPGLADAETVLPALARERLAPWMFVLFSGALVSAILSTVDSTLLVSASLLSHNVLLPVLGERTEREKVRLARAGVVVLGVVAWALARRADGVLALVEEASALGSSGVLVVTTFALFTRAGGRASAYGALLAGLAVYVAGSHLGWTAPYLASLAAALLAYLGGAILAGPAGARAERPALSGAGEAAGRDGRPET